MSPTPSPSMRSSEATTRRILDAAREEFAEHGFKGARIERIAEDARANKQLIYRYFGDKDGLHEAVLEEMVAVWSTEQTALPDDTTSAGASDARTWARLSVWEMLAAGEGPAPGADVLRGSILRRVEEVRREQREGLVDESLDPEMVLLLRAALAALPWVAPHLVEAATERHPFHDPEIRRRLRDFGAHLTAPSRLGDTP